MLATALVAGLLVSVPGPTGAAGAAVTGEDSKSVERLYEAYFLRDPDPSGLRFWSDQHAQGLPLAEISSEFARSDEFVDRYGSLSDQQFVDLVYRNVLGRAADGAGLDHWVTQLRRGTLTRGGVMLSFSDSAEFKQTSGIVGSPPAGADEQSLERLYLAYYGRAGDAAGVAYWRSQLASGRSLDFVSARFAEAPEFIALYGSVSDRAFVSLVYRNVLDRPADQAGLEHWVGFLENGSLNRGQVMVAFSDSSEFKAATGVFGPLPPPDPSDIPQAGNPNGGAAVPPEARAVDTSSPDRIVGSGTAASCTSAAVVDAVAQGGTIRFDCGPDPVTIVMTETAKVVNNADPDVVIDGGGLVTLSGGGERRILYMNTCDAAQVWTTSHCQNQDHPRLTVQNINFVDGNATGETAEGGGGGAIFVRGGRLKIVNVTFARNRCDSTGPDVGGAAVRVLSQHDGQPVYVVNSTFGGAPGQGNICSNGGGLSSIGVSMTVINSVFTHNEAIGVGANPAKTGTPGGGNGGAIYNDGNTFTLRVLGSILEDNHAREGGGAVFFVSNNRTGSLVIDGATMARNPSDGFETAGLPGIFYLGRGNAAVTNSSLS